MRAPAVGAPAPELYRGAVEQCAWADRVGLHAVYLGEHHGADDGYLPSPIVHGAAIAAVTSRLTIHLSAVIAVLCHPLRLAEDLAVLDLLSDGRLQVTLGMGYRPHEYEMFGVSQRERVALLVEAMAVLPQAWKGEPFDFRGTQVMVRPRPARPSGPPLFMGANTEAAALRAARLGVAFNPTSAVVYEAYAAECTRLGRDVPRAPARQDMQFVFVSDDPDRDWPMVAPYVLHAHNSYASWQAERKTGARTFLPYDGVPDLQADPRYHVWTADECVAQFSALAPDEEFVIQPLLGGMPPDLAWTSLERIEREVLPRLAQSA
jgi:alkanesulfonate monooxygenase SsuD/methylene tetrahydromethanopterin reductase-like flavin-dependent oxidoreductase (luciferase family)